MFGLSGLLKDAGKNRTTPRNLVLRAFTPIHHHELHDVWIEHCIESCFEHTVIIASRVGIRKILYTHDFESGAEGGRGGGESTVVSCAQDRQTKRFEVVHTPEIDRHFRFSIIITSCCYCLMLLRFISIIIISILTIMVWLWCDTHVTDRHRFRYNPNYYFIIVRSESTVVWCTLDRQSLLWITYESEIMSKFASK